jgi:hypothetical protein
MLQRQLSHLKGRKFDDRQIAVVSYKTYGADLQKTRHVIAKHCWWVTSLRMLGGVFTEPLTRSGLHNPVGPLLRVGRRVCVLRALPINGFTCHNIIIE